MPRIAPLLSLLILCGLCVPASLHAQESSRNVTTVGQWMPQNGTPGVVVLDQHVDRPYAYLATSEGVAIVDLDDPASPRLLTRFALADVHDLTLFRHDGRTYLIAATQADGTGGATLYDVTRMDVPPPTPQRISPQGGLRNVFAYKHSGGTPLLAATGGGDIYLYDLRKVLDGQTAPLHQLSTPEQIRASSTGFESAYAAFHADAEEDRLYTAGAGGFFVYSILDPTQPELRAEVSSAAVHRGSQIQATPNGRFVSTTTNYRTAPMRLFDLQPVYEGTIPRARTAVGAWTANWEGFAERHELRWPFIFAASYEDGLQVVNMMDPAAPYTDAFFVASEPNPAPLANRDQHRRGTVDVDVRNHDGLVAVSDTRTGLWLLRADAFYGWDGRGWGLPNISTVQHWEKGPVGADLWGWD